MSRIGDWIQTATGLKMYPLDPDVDEIDIESIAHSLSNMCRFNGHTSRFYSVAEHSCHVCDLLPPAFKLAGLLHDASEAYLCDVPRPVKRSAGFSQPYMQAEHALMCCIATKYGFPWPMEQAVEDADESLLHTEALALMGPLHVDWPPMAAPVAKIHIPCWTPSVACSEFLMRFREFSR